MVYQGKQVYSKEEFVAVVQIEKHLRLTIEEMEKLPLYTEKWIKSLDGKYHRSPLFKFYQTLMKHYKNMGCWLRNNQFEGVAKSG